ncbi:MAG: TonB-dependent receptor [Bacteroidia bacterium]|nr:TonB-dependent receptor [Bacteroidia bacterium]
MLQKDNCYSRYWAGRLFSLRLITGLMISLLPYSMYAQVTGTVTTERGEALPGVTIRVQGTSQGTLTDDKGKYKVDETSATSVLIFSYVGYAQVEETVGSRTVINVSMSESNSSLEEVVIIGYGTQKKSSLTGAVSSVSSEDLKALPVISLTQAMQGRVPGVQVTNNSSPGTEPIIRIRGVGSVSLNPNPLYVIDGIPAGGINNIDPSDIESLEVLKDASAAAIYGSRAANGVILVTTKKGSSGKMQVNLDSYYGMQTAWRTLDLLDRDEYIQYGTALLTASGQPVPGRFSSMDTPVYDGASTTFAQTNTDWQDVMFRSAPISDNKLSLSGGNDKSRFYTSLGYFTQDGIMPFTDYNRKSFRINSDHKVNKLISIGQTLMIASDRQTAERDGGGRSLVMNTMRMVPYWPERDPTKLGGFSTTAQGLDATDPENPLRVAEHEQQFQVNNGVKMIGSIFADVNFASWLKYRFTMGVDYANSRFNGFLPIYNDGNRTRPLAQVQDNRSQFVSTVYTNALTFEKSFGAHNLNILGVAERQDSRFRGLNSSGQRPDNNIRVLQGISNPSTNSSISENVLFSYIGRLNYNFDEKYLLSASVRRDGSSKFAPGKKWGTFPAVSLGWRLSEEGFMDAVPAISELKLRGSWGQSGYNSIGDYEWQPLVQANNTLYPFGNTPALGSYFNQLGNIDLSWEVTTMTNFGVDVSLWNDKVFLTAEYYNRETDGLLLRVPVPVSIGYSSSPLANVGSMRNYGFEAVLGYNHTSENLNWSLSGTFDITRNEVLSLATANATIDAGTNADFGGFAITRTQEGQPIQSFYGWQVEKIFQTQEEINSLNAQAPNGFYQNDKTSPGDIKFRDINGDGRVNADDRTFLGSYLPKFSYGLNWTGNYKNFDFTLYIQGVYGNKVYNGTKVIGQGMLRLFNASTDVLDAWTPQNTDTDVPRAISGDPNQNSRTSDRFLEDGSYLRVKNFSIGYTIPQSKIGDLTGNVLNRIRIYVSSQNLLTFTKYTGYDPEVGSRFGALLTQGIDYGQFPQARTLMAGINLGF